MVQDYLEQRHGFTGLCIDERLNDREPDGERRDMCMAIEGRRPRVRSYFLTVDRLMEFVTANWSVNYVMPVKTPLVADALARRPFFLLINVEASVTQRHQRLVKSCLDVGKEPPPLEVFITEHDKLFYTHPTNLSALAPKAKLTILNHSTRQALWASLDALNLPDPARLRPTWDAYFMALASLAATRSNCMRRRVGCVLVRACRVISTGYNGTPRHLPNCNAGGCPRCNDPEAASGGAGLSTCLCIHAEENALLEAGRDRVGEGSVLYCDTCPCLTCSIKICQVGIGEVVYSQSYYMDTEAAQVFRQAGVKLRQFSPPAEGLVEMNGSMCFDGQPDGTPYANPHGQPGR